jgi:hypothetical protein
MLGDLIVTAESEERSDERFLEEETRCLGNQFLCRVLPIVRDDDRLYQDIEFQLSESFTSVLSNVANGGIEPFGIPAHFMVLPVLECPPQHGQADDVGVAGGVGQGLLAVHTDQNGEMLLA